MLYADEPSRDRRSRLAVLNRPLLVPDRPEDHRRMISIAENEALEFLHQLGRSSHESIFIEDQQAEPVARLEQRGSRRIVTCANGIRAHSLDLLEPVPLQLVGKGGADARMIRMKA